MITSITFDVARTLIFIQDQKEYWREVSEYLVSNGLELYPQEIKAAREYVFFVDLPRYQLNNWYDWTCQILNRLNIINPASEVVYGMIKILKQSVDNYRLYSDVAPTLERLSDNDLTFSALTTIPEFKLEYVLEPIRGKLQHIMTGGNAGCVKGNPSMYKQDLQLKGAIPTQNLFVGDDHYYDIEIPHKLGHITVHIEREDRPVENKFSDFQISNLSELPNILEELNEM